MCRQIFRLWRMQRGAKRATEKDFDAPNTTEWIAYLESNKQAYPLWYEEAGEEVLPQQAIEMIHRITEGDAIVTTDVGQHQMWAAQYYALNNGHSWITSGGLGRWASASRQQLVHSLQSLIKRLLPFAAMQASK